MRLPAVILFFAASLASASVTPPRPKPNKAKSAAAVSQGRRKPTGRSNALQQENAKQGKKANARRVVVTRMVHGRLVRVSRLARVPAGPIVPAHPEPERLKEIQQALADKGYFKGEPNGEWNADSVAALKQFQTDRNLTADGKISALSLIGLGLGPKHEGSAATPQPPVKPEQDTPATVEPR